MFQNLEYLTFNQQNKNRNDYQHNEDSNLYNNQNNAADTHAKSPGSFLFPRKVFFDFDFLNQIHLIPISMVCQTSHQPKTCTKTKNKCCFILLFFILQVTQHTFTHTADFRNLAFFRTCSMRGKRQFCGVFFQFVKLGFVSCTVKMKSLPF